MKRDYDFSKRTKNPYASKLPKQQVAIRLDAETNAYFTQMAQKYGLSVEDLINL